MKKLLLIYFFAVSILPMTALAHVLEADGSIGVVMHITPDDDPIVGKPASFYFEFKDKQGKFRSEKCDCQFELWENDRQLFSQSLFRNGEANGLDNALINYTFTQKSVYQIRINGTPIDDSSFQAFNLKYSIRVDRGVNDPPSKGLDWRLIVFGISLVGFVAVTIRSKLANTPAHKTIKPKGADVEY